MRNDDDDDVDDVDGDDDGDINNYPNSLNTNNIYNISYCLFKFVRTGLVPFEWVPNRSFDSVETE